MDPPRADNVHAAAPATPVAGGPGPSGDTPKPPGAPSPLSRTAPMVQEQAALAGVAPLAPAAGPAGPSRALLRTMVGFAAPEPKQEPAPAPAPGSSGDTSKAPKPPGLAPAGRVAIKGTMIGFAADPAPRGAPAPQPVVVATPAPAPMPMPSAKGTMLGVAMPGIAPLAPGVNPPPALPAPQHVHAQQTMMGVAMPGIAPTHAGQAPPDGSQGWSERGPHDDPAGGAGRPGQPPGPALRRAVEIAPMPPPLSDEEPLPAPPLIVPKRGVPLGVLGGILGGLVLLAGGAVALLWKSSPLVAQPQIDAQGRDQLHLTCVGCPDGTVAEMDGQKGIFESQIADLNLASPLRVGDNKLVVHLDRPSLGRDEAVSLTVPLTYRVRTDLAEISAPHPAIMVRVDAVPGTDVLLDGKPVALDATGSGSYAIDISGETEGTAEDVRIVDRSIAYVVTPKGGTPQKGTVTAKVGVTPLRLEAPGTHPVIDTPTFHIAGRTSKATSTAPGQPPQATTVTMNGHPLTVGGDGVFAEPEDAPAVADLPIELRASAPLLAPRTAHFTVRRVEHLADEAKAREALPALGYDVILANPAANAGQAVIVEGDVVDARVANQQTLAVVDDARGCAHSPCLIRIVTGGETPLKRGDAIRAYGRVTRAVQTANGAVPEMEADFVVKGHAPGARKGAAKTDALDLGPRQ